MTNDPFRQLAAVLELRMAGHAGQALQGLPAELGTLTDTGLKLDHFKHELTSYLLADWLVKAQFPAFSLTGTMTAPVLADGRPAGNAAISERTRFDFEAGQIDDVRLNWSAGMKPGDRVVVLPVHGGKDAVVLCKAVSRDA